MSYKQKSRIFLTIEVKQFITELRERNKTIAEIGDAVYKEFQIKTSKSAIQRTFAEKNEILATVKNDATETGSIISQPMKACTDGVELQSSHE